MLQNTTKKEKSAPGAPLDTTSWEFYIECLKEPNLNIELLIRHRWSFQIRNTVWYLPSYSVLDHLLGRPTGERLGIDAKIPLDFSLSTVTPLVTGEVEIDKLDPINWPEHHTFNQPKERYQGNDH